MVKKLLISLFLSLFGMGLANAETPTDATERKMRVHEEVCNWILKDQFHYSTIAPYLCDHKLTDTHIVIEDLHLHVRAWARFQGDQSPIDLGGKIYVEFHW